MILELITKIIHIWHKEIYNDFVNFNFNFIKLKDLESAGDSIMIDSWSMLEVIKDDTQTTSEV